MVNFILPLNQNFVDEFQKVKKNVISKLQGLSPELTYHCLNHTLDVLEQSLRIAAEEKITDQRELYLLKIAALYHDTGFLRSYIDHEERSCEIFLADSTNYGLSKEEKSVIVNLIMATRIPQRPISRLEQIICDADLDYLGRDDFFSIGDNLRKEFLLYRVVADDEEWEQMQLKFILNHKYHTLSSRRLREPAKQSNFTKLV